MLNVLNQAVRINDSVRNYANSINRKLIDRRAERMTRARRKLRLKQLKAQGHQALPQTTMIYFTDASGEQRIASISDIHKHDLPHGTELHIVSITFDPETGEDLEFDYRGTGHIS